MLLNFTQFIRETFNTIYPYEGRYNKKSVKYTFTTKDGKPGLVDFRLYSARRIGD